MKFTITKITKQTAEVEADTEKAALLLAFETDFVSGSSQYVLSEPIKPQPWPIALQPMKLLAKEGDRGAGDIIARVIGPIGGEAFKVWYKATFGKDCGCGNRQDALNRRWPLP